LPLPRPQEDELIAASGFAPGASRSRSRAGSGVGTSSLEALAAAAPPGPPSPRARALWEIPTYTAAAAQPVPRIFDATASSFRGLVERQIHLQRVFPAHAAEAASAREASKAAQVPRIVRPGPFGGAGDGSAAAAAAASAASSRSASRPASPSRGVGGGSRSVSPLAGARVSRGSSPLGSLARAGANAHVLSAVSDFDASELLRPKGAVAQAREAGAVASAALAPFGSSLRPLRPGQHGCRHTHIHDVWHK